MGDSFILTENGYEPLTEFAKDIEDVVCWPADYPATCLLQQL